jgi:hypothetical protein
MRARRAFLCVAAFVLLLLWVLPARAQDEDIEDGAPPPLKIIPRLERSELDTQSDAKDRTKTSLTLMDGHIASIERLTTSRNFDAAFRELGSFEALMDDSVVYLQRRSVEQGRVLDAFKKLEMGLRAFMPRIETVRRELPLRFDTYIRKLMKGLRDARAKAMDPMFSDSVVRVPANDHQL